MNEVRLTELLTEVQLADSYWCAPFPWCFSIQRYCPVGPTSDVDVLVLAPDYLVEKSADVRAIMARRLCEWGVNRRSVKDQPQLHTLKWSDEGRGVEVSVLFNREAMGPIIVTCFLRDFFKAHEEFRIVVLSVLMKLREAGAINSHG